MQQICNSLPLACLLAQRPSDLPDGFDLSKLRSVRAWSIVGGHQAAVVVCIRLLQPVSFSQFLTVILFARYEAHQTDMILSLIHI